MTQIHLILGLLNTGFTAEYLGRCTVLPIPFTKIGFMFKLELKRSPQPLSIFQESHQSLSPSLDKGVFKNLSYQLGAAYQELKYYSRAGFISP